MTIRRYALRDDQWARIESLLPDKPEDPGQTAADNRFFIDAVLCVGRTEAPWRDLPGRYGKWNSVFTRFNRWAKNSVWERIFEVLQEPNLEWMMIDTTMIQAHQHAAGQKSDAPTEAFGRSRGGFSTKVYAAVDALGNPLKLILRPGQRADITEAEAPTKSCPFEAMVADKGFDSADFVAWAEALEAETVIPSRKTNTVQQEINANLHKDRTRSSGFSVASSSTGALRPAMKRPRVTT